MTVAEHQSIRKFDSAVIILNGLESERLEVGKTRWNSTALARVSGHDSDNEKDGMG